MLIIVKWLGAMQFVKDVSLARSIPNLLGGIIIPTFISSPRTKFTVPALSAVQKTRNKGKRRKNVHGFSPAINYKPSDMRKIVAMDMDEKEVDIRNFDFSENL